MRREEGGGREEGGERKVHISDLVSCNLAEWTRFMLISSTSFGIMYAN